MSWISAEVWEWSNETLSVPATEWLASEEKSPKILHEHCDPLVINWISTSGWDATTRYVKELCDCNSIVFFHETAKKSISSRVSQEPTDTEWSDESELFLDIWTILDNIKKLVSRSSSRSYLRTRRKLLISSKSEILSARIRKRPIRDSI